MYLLTWDYQIIENSKIKQETMFLNNLRVISYLLRNIHEWSIYFNLFFFSSNLENFDYPYGWLCINSYYLSLITSSFSLFLFLFFTFHREWKNSDKSELEKRSNINCIRLIFAILEDQLDNASHASLRVREMQWDKKRSRKAGNSATFSS